MGVWHRGGGAWAGTSSVQYTYPAACSSPGCNPFPVDTPFSKPSRAEADYESHSLCELKFLRQRVTSLGTEILGEPSGVPEVVAAGTPLSHPRLLPHRLPECADKQPVEVTLVLRQGQSPALLSGPEPEQGGPAAPQPGGL